MKILVVCFMLCLVSTIIQDCEAQDPSLPLLAILYDDSWNNLYYSVQLNLLNGEPVVDRDQETTYLAAVGHDGAGTLMAPITACGSDTPYPGEVATSPYGSIILNFVLEKATGNLVTDPAILTQAPTIMVAPDYLGVASGATTCGAEIDASVAGGLRLVIQTFKDNPDTTTPGTHSVYWDFTIGEGAGTVGTLHSRPPSAFSKAIVGYLNPKYVVTPPLTPIALIPPTITLSLNLLDGAGGVISMIDLGDPFKLQLQATIDADPTAGYKVGLDLAGVVVKECVVGTDAAVTADTQTFIQNTCAVDTVIFSTSQFGSGIGFTETSSTLVGNQQTYVAESHLLEAGAITPIPDLTTAIHDLYFKCTVEFSCYDAATGPCNGVHCTSRKKRSVDTAVPLKKKTVQKVVHKFRQTKALPEDTFETALPKDTKTETAKKTRPCSETLMFKTTVGTLGSAVVILFFGVIFSYYDLKKAQGKAKMRRHGLDASKMSGGSRTELMADNLSTASSEKNSKKC